MIRVFFLVHLFLKKFTFKLIKHLHGAISPQRTITSVRKKDAQYDRVLFEILMILSSEWLV